MFTEEILEKCQQNIGYTFKNIQLLKQSLTHSSIRKENEYSNERLEFLGDAILGLVTCEYLYQTFQEFDEGDLTLIKSEVVSRETLAKLVQKLELQNYFAYAGGIGKTQNFPISILANEYEAIVGAIYLDGGMEPAKQFILSNLKDEIETVIKDPYQKNYKSLLQFISQKYLGTTPSYQSLPSKESTLGVPQFTSCVVIGKRKFLAGIGKNKKEAEQEAAHAALQILSLEDPVISAKLSNLLQLYPDPNKNQLIQNPSLLRDSQTLLQHISEKLNLPEPIYHHTKTIDDEDNILYHTHISIGGRSFPEVQASRYKESEKQAARTTLEILSEERIEDAATFSPLQINQLSQSQESFPFPILFNLSQPH